MGWPLFDTFCKKKYRKEMMSSRHALFLNTGLPVEFFTDLPNLLKKWAEISRKNTYFELNKIEKFTVFSKNRKFYKIEKFTLFENETDFFK